MCKSEELDKHKFWIKVEDIFTINGRGQVIHGETNNTGYRGIICCGNKTYNILGSEWVPSNAQKCGYLLETFDLTDDYKGKIFTSIDS